MGSRAETCTSCGKRFVDRGLWSNLSLQNSSGVDASVVRLCADCVRSQGEREQHLRIEAAKASQTQAQTALIAAQAELQVAARELEIQRLTEEAAEKARYDASATAIAEIDREFRRIERESQGTTVSWFATWCLGIGRTKG